ncbi:hypothetical protein [Chryseobacterium gwangjuense]|uniref:hypothetical protein n=1 Tax=Chryseobacterium gwangjuense TaxID=1069980 RepID=UPI001E5B0546|nr:hypothetical protein [Chryseobacterium gwangjuense]MCE3076959.1 hypothetical protein [Chryseobacterium gwangjuense]
MNIPDNIDNEKEIRIYRGNGISNNGKVFRIYLSENRKWNAELIQWFLPKKINEDEFQIISPIVTKLESKIPLEQVFLNLEALNIEYLPKEELFQYKKSTNKVVFDEDEKEYVIMSTEKSVLDGVDFLVKYQSDTRKNEFHYSNPQSYLNNYPGIDEYEGFVKILKYVEDNFNIKLN